MPNISTVDTSRSQFRRTVLPNGVRVVSEYSPSVRSVSVGVWIATGSRDESKEKCGISHFIEHMVFKGTDSRRMHHIAQRMESVGGYLNAFTSKEYTCFYARGLDEHLHRALNVTCDLILAPVFPAKELDKEKEVVVEEIKMYEDVPEDLIFDRFEGAVYGDHPLGRPIVGYPETVRAFSREDLVTRLSSHYTPERIVIASAGNVDHERIVREVERLFDGLKRPCGSNGQAFRTVAPNPPPQHIQEGRSIQQAHIVIGGRSFGLSDPRRGALSVLNTVLGGGMSSRLNQNIREKYGYCYQIYSFANMLSDTADFGVYMATDGSKVDHARRLIHRELNRMVSRSISPRQLSQAKSQLKGSLMLGLESLSHRMSRLGRLEMYDREFVSLDDIIEEVNAVTAEDVRQVAADLFDLDQLSTVVFVPER
ncbi:MAG TPA: pitrilysin family protein [Rhodothermales bacterium]|nr:pitrilysin family protein [Rhodothermales bacterium]